MAISARVYPQRVALEGEKGKHIRFVPHFYEVAGRDDGGDHPERIAQLVPGSRSVSIAGRNTSFPITERERYKTVQEAWMRQKKLHQVVGISRDLARKLYGQAKAAGVPQDHTVMHFETSTHETGFLNFSPEEMIKNEQQLREFIHLRLPQALREALIANDGRASLDFYRDEYEPGKTRTVAVITTPVAVRKKEKGKQ
ncbi:MAG TPA: hypothetical protein VI874_02740 [Candidatus Norongarragalinales archaeon]|nr:hypothetical protein [Candidatus Norongarragalinales archaeon]